MRNYVGAKVCEVSRERRSSKLAANTALTIVSITRPRAVIEVQFIAQKRGNPGNGKKCQEELVRRLHAVIQPLFSTFKPTSVTVFPREVLKIGVQEWKDLSHDLR